MMRGPMMALGAVLIALAPGCGVNSAPAQGDNAAASSSRAPHDGRLMPPEKVADQVWYKRQPPRIWSAVIGNVGIVEQSDGVVVIDSGGSIADGRDIVTEVAQLTDKPIKAVVVTHWHNDHPLGVPGILERYPGARVIATAATARMMKDIMGKNVGVGRNDPELDKARLENTRSYVPELLTSARDNSLTEVERREFATEAAWVAQRVHRQMGNYVAMPTETFTDRLLLDDVIAPVELSFHGAANTAGDLVAWLPRQQVLFSGDSVVAPSPYGFNASVRSWVPVLEALKGFDFAFLVPGHGAVQRDKSYLDVMIWSLRNVETQVRKAVSAGKTVEATWAGFDQSAHIRRFRADAPWALRWLRGYWLEPIVASAHEEITKGKVVEGG